MPNERDKASDTCFPTFLRWAVSVRSMASRILKWPPRFSLRSLLLLTAIVAAYLGCWTPTKTRGVRDVERRFNESQVTRIAMQTEAYLPLIIALDDSVAVYVDPRSNDALVIAHRNYYFWFFGFVAKLPFEREVTWHEQYSG